MADATVTTKGQITIPKSVRERLGLHPGDLVEFVEENGAFRVRKKSTTSAFRRWRGYLKSEFGGRDPVEVVREMRDP